MKCNIVVIILAGFFTISAQAERVIVMMKDKQAFQSARMVQQMKDVYLLNGFNWAANSTNGFLEVEGKIQDSLENLNTLIVETADEFQLARLRSNPGVVLVEREVFHPLPKPIKGFLGKSRKVMNFQSEGVRTPWGIKAVRAPQAWSASNQGEGSRVLVLDTGLDTTHPSIKENFEQGRDFTENSSGDDITDLIGHGTHVAGTIAAAMDNTGFVGVAPKAKILAGRVCSENGCSNIAVAKGIEWGIQEHVDVISMSLGGMYSTSAERKAVAAADKAGLTVVAASGNDGINKVSYPAALPTVIAVGAVDSDLKRADFSQWGPELAIVAPGVSVLSSVPQGTGREASVEIAYNKGTSKIASTTFEGAREVIRPETNILVNCGVGKNEDFAAADAKGKFALVKRGEIKFLDKINNAIKAGASGVIVYNNVPGLLQGALTDNGDVLPIAVFMIEQEVGEDLVNQISAGQLVKATLQTLTTDYAAFDGTSMATPHVAGVVALVKSANRSLNGAQVKEILKSTALTLSPNSNNEVGAGLVNAEAAVMAARQTK